MTTPTTSAAAEAAVELPILRGAVATTPIEQLTGVGVKRGKVLREAGIATLADLLLRLPRRYLDRSRILAIDVAPVGEELTLLVRVLDPGKAPHFRGGGRQPPREVVVEDDTGRLRCVWFRGGNYHNFQAGDLLAISGRLELFRQQRQMSHPEYEFISMGDNEASATQDLLHTGGIVPLYATSADLKERGLRSRGFRRLVRAALRRVADDLPSVLQAAVVTELGLPTLVEALWQVHFPHTAAVAETGRRRLALEELYHLQLFFGRQRLRRQQTAGEAMPPSDRLVPQLLASLTYALTAAQVRVVAQISADMQGSTPMRRLLHGDVGSGKTLVALCAALQALESGAQVAVMAPTEILADQHFYNWQRLLAPMGLCPVLLKGGQRVAVRRELLTGLQTGALPLVVGTHALLQEGVQFSRLGLVVIDEQHRFGVEQRQKLSSKRATADLLVMTATPIPRSLALSLYGDLDVSVLDQLPPGRQLVRTALRAPEHRHRIFEFVAEQVVEGRQVYVVYPTIEEAGEAGLLSAEQAFQQLTKGPLAACRVGLVHGRLPAADKRATMASFIAGRIDVLVATTVIEVGVDVANASVIVIEHAERFGLAQLHQLRGRVGRGAEASYCILVAYPPAGQDNRSGQRMQAVCATQDGFELARTDMELRGPGELLGTRQAGQPELRVANLLKDEDLLGIARQLAFGDVGLSLP